MLLSRQYYNCGTYITFAPEYLTGPGDSTDYLPKKCPKCGKSNKVGEDLIIAEKADSV